MADLESRIQRLEDIEEIKQLQAKHCRFATKAMTLMALQAFTEKRCLGWGRVWCRSRADAIRRHFEGAGGRISIARHQVMNPIIEVADQIATGHWLLFQPCTGADRAVWLAAYEDQYEKQEDVWMISRLSIEVAFFSPYEKDGLSIARRKRALELAPATRHLALWKGPSNRLLLGLSKLAKSSRYQKTIN